eukprot:scaffold108315_cov30-Tisochrysis_lutea.AAC.1
MAKRASAPAKKFDLPDPFAPTVKSRTGGRQLHTAGLHALCRASATQLHSPTTLCLGLNGSASILSL